MPKQLEEKLKREAASRGYSEERTDRFVYGTLRKTGWKPSREKGKHTAEDAANALAARVRRS